MAVRLDIRPRLRLSPEPPAAARRAWRLPALALPAAGYWVAMAALTYVFAHLGPHPLEEAFASEPATTQEAPLSPPLLPEPQAPEPEPTTEIAASPAEPAPLAVPEPPPVQSSPALAETEHEPQDHRKAGRREGLLASNRYVEPRLDEPATFPEFTDTSQPVVRERAADGPRIDSLFEPAKEQPVRAAAELSPPAIRADAPVAVTSCEAAVARNDEQLEIGAQRGPADITREAYASILQAGRYLVGCRVPERTVFEVCAAVKHGRAIGVTVTSNPSSAAINACVRSAVARLQFPSSERLDVTHTRFDAVAR